MLLHAGCAWQVWFVAHARAATDLGIEKVIEEAKGEGDEGKEGGEGDGDADGGDDAGDADAGDAKEDGDDGEGKGTEDGDGEGEGKQEEAAPPPEPPMTDHAGELFAIVDPASSGEINLSDLLAILQVALKGYGEPTLKFTLAACDLGDTGRVNEAELFNSIRWSASQELSPVVMNHLRKLWRGLDGEGSGADVTVSIEQFFEKLGEDDVLGKVLLTEVQIPVKRPGDEDAAAEED